MAVCLAVRLEFRKALINSSLFIYFIFSFFGFIASRRAKRGLILSVVQDLNIWKAMYHSDVLHFSLISVFSDSNF